MATCRKCSFKKVRCLNPGRRSPNTTRHTAEAIKELRHSHSQELLLKISKMARSTFYYCLKQLKQVDKWAPLRAKIKLIYHQHKGRYGYRRIALAMRQQGQIINHKTILRIMNECGLKSLVKIKKYKSYRGEQGKVAPNFLQRNFYSAKPNKKWVTDVTEFSVGGKKLYLSPIMDLYNGEIVSYSLSERPTSNLTMKMLQKALTKLPEKSKLILHSDQGWQYQMAAWQQILKKRKIKQSMSRKGNCLDNAAMENFFSILKSELFYLKKFNSILALKRDIIKYIYYYNNYRIKLKLNGLSPVQYRTKAA
ncbi:IS3 family transposase [Chitinophaga eiseniae]|uniref:IS3 family transposase n=2 Tax=Chitinophaga eiseniae TaxID=634771 RepID=A0A847SYE0_9BACT|nr:IS3 family transposase [Chitinophaga eiseniae]NLR83062.1 IS3 family transposase [Chitinophaga eiseniae]